MSEPQLTTIEAALTHEALTTELLVEEGNFRVEIEGTEVKPAPELTPAHNTALIEAAETDALAQLAALDMVEFVCEPEIALVATPLELLPPTAAAETATATHTRTHLRGEAARANGLEFEIQRSHG